MTNTSVPVDPSRYHFFKVSTSLVQIIYINTVISYYDLEAHFPKS